MDRARLRKTFLRNKSNKDKEAYNKQRNYCVFLIQKTKQDYYNNFDHRKVVDNKPFCKYIEPLFPIKTPVIRIKN